MIFLWNNDNSLEEDEESESETDLNDALLDELDSDEVVDELLEGEEPPLIPLVPEIEEEEEEGEDETVKAFFDAEDDGEGDDEGDYDSFDDKDEL
jgi:hypothetical protein